MSTSTSWGINLGHVTIYVWEGSNEDMGRQKAGSLSKFSTTSSSQDMHAPWGWQASLVGTFGRVTTCGQRSSLSAHKSGIHEGVFFSMRDNKLSHLQLSHYGCCWDAHRLESCVTEFFPFLIHFRCLCMSSACSSNKHIVSNLWGRVCGPPAALGQVIYFSFFIFLCSGLVGLVVWVF